MQQLFARLFLPRLTFAAHARHCLTMMLLFASLTMIGLGSERYDASVTLIVLIMTGWAFAHGFWWQKVNFELLRYLAMMALAGIVGTLLPLLLFVAIVDKLPSFNADVFLLACARMALRVTAIVISACLMGRGVRLILHDVKQ